MQCKNCGGALFYKDGVFVCSSCGGSHSVNDFYEDLDTYICYVESDESGRRTKDSLLAQEIYRTLEQAGIKAFYARISAERIAGAGQEKACMAALYNAKTVVLLGTTTANFRTLAEKYAPLYAGKTVIPVFADMDAYGIPKEISAIQALDYRNVGAGVDLVRSLYNALGRKQELDYGALVKKTAARKLAIAWIVGAVIVLALFALGVWWLGNTLISAPQLVETAPTTVPVTQPMLTPAQIQENMYCEAVACAESGSNSQAIQLFSQLSGYKDSDKQLHVLYQSFAGYYKDENGVAFRLRVWDGNVADIELTHSSSKGVCRITAGIQLSGEEITLPFVDSENNGGTVTLSLGDQGIDVHVKTTDIQSGLSIGELKTTFLLSEKSDKPHSNLNAQILLGWLTDKATMQDLSRMGIELEYTEEGWYAVKNSDVTVALIETMDVPFVCGVNAPAELLIPDYVGKTVNKFEKNGVLYIPWGEIAIYTGEGTDISVGHTGNPSKKIEKNTPVCIVIASDYYSDFEDYL